MFKNRKIVRVQDEVDTILGPNIPSPEILESKLTDVGDGLWDLHTQVLIKKRLNEPEPIRTSENPEIKEKEISYKFPQNSLVDPSSKKSGLCDYSNSSSEEEDGEGEEEAKED